MTPRSSQAILAFVIISTACLAAVALVVFRAPPEQVSIQRPALLVDVVVARKQSLRVNVSSQGNVMPATETQLVTEVSGKVVVLTEAFEAGTVVEEGELLLRVDDRNYQTNLKRAQAAVASARSRLAQEKGLAAVAAHDLEKYPRKHVNDEARQLALRQPQLAEALAALESAQADLQQAQTDLDRSYIRAPYRAMIRSTEVDLGQYLSVGAPLGSLFSIAQAEVRLPVPMDRLAYLQLPGNAAIAPPAPVTLENELGQQWQARLLRSEGVLDARSRVLFLVAVVDDPYALESQEPPLRMGSFVKADIQGRRFDNVVVVPRHVLRSGNQVWVVNEQGKLVNREVQTLRSAGELVYIHAGLAEGERVSLANIPGAIAGLRVEVNRETPSTALLEEKNPERSAASSSGDEPNPT